MNRISWKVQVLSILLSVFVFPAAASADPIAIRVTGGDLFVDARTRIGVLDLIGEGDFSLTGRVDAAFGIFKPWEQCVATPDCHPGTVVSLRAFWSGFDIRSGQVSFDGRTYLLREIGGASAGVSFDGSFVLPPFAQSAVVTAPFQLVFPGNPFIGGSSFHFPFPDSLVGFLYGSGTATINLSPWGPVFPDRWGVDSVRYEFDPVPEPATMLLVGVGIAGVARRLKRRRTSA